jgi:hypothetical protein
VDIPSAGAGAVSDVPNYGRKDKPWPELPPAASLYAVQWGGAAILITRPSQYTPLIIASHCPALLTSQGSWVTWYRSEAHEHLFSDGFFGVPDEGSSFAAELKGGATQASWGDPGIVTSGDAGFPRIIYSSDDGNKHWTIRPADSFTTVYISPFEPNGFWWRADIGMMALEVWHCVMVSWVVGGARSIVINDVIKDVAYEPEPFTGLWDGGYQDDGDAIAPVPERLALLYTEGSHYDWWLSTEFIDFTDVVNRRRFITANLKPVSLGADGSNGSPTGRKPEFFFHPGATLADFSRNRGTAGDGSWTDADGLNNGYLIDPVWKKVSQPAAAGTT